MISRNTLNAAIRVFFWGTVITGALLLTQLGHCATTSGRKNSLGTVSYEKNPLMYTAGSLAQTGDAVTNVDGNLNLRVKPLGTYVLYDESILFCGLPIDKFQGISEPFVLTYERRAHRTVREIGCHNLIRVDHVVIDPRLQ